jgi:DNA-binding CsgD family transcriptional regulator
MFGSTFFEVVDQLSAKRRPTDVFLKSIARRYGLDHLVYFTINLPVATEGPYYAATYSPQWVSHYFARDYASIDPALHKTLGGILPVDWSTIDRKAAHIRRFFGEAIEFGVGNQGLSFPIRGLHRETAVFSLATSLPDTEWQIYARHYMRDFQIIGHFIHNRMFEALGIDTSPGAPLLHRELECLRWCAAGKTKWETGEILGISERTVKFHLDQARHKLNCMNVTHAVAKALAIGLITPG